MDNPSFRLNVKTNLHLSGRSLTAWSICPWHSLANRASRVLSAVVEWSIHSKSSSRTICFRFLEAAKCAKILYRTRSEEHTSELQSLMRNSYAVLCLQKKSKR